MTKAIAILLTLAAANAPAQVAPVTLAIEHVVVLPMTRDTALADHTVLVSGDRITWIGPSSRARIPRTARRIDGHGGFVIPGLADMHVHLDRREFLSQFLPVGITTVRNMRGAPIHLAWRDSIAKGTIDGPVIFTSGPSLRGRPGEGFVAASNPAEAEAVVRRHAKDGYDMIKVLYGISPDVYRRITDVAREVGIPVVGHVLQEVGLELTLAAGQVSLEHAGGLFEASFGARIVDRLRAVGLSGVFPDEGKARPEYERGARAIARAGAWVGTIVSARDGQCGAPSPRTRRIMTTLRRERVQILAGSDVGIGPIAPGTGLHCELRTLVASGLSPYEALVTATANAGRFAAAHLASADVFGTVAPGARADLLLLRADPRVDIRVIERPVIIIARGRPLYDRKP